MITIEDLNIEFDGKKLFNNLFFTVKKGTKACLVGPSGSGKSSVLLMLLGFYKPTNGSIVINNKIVSHQTIKKIRSEIAWMPQDLNLGIETVKEMVYLPFTFAQNQLQKPTEQQMLEMFEKLGLESVILTKKTTEISGGQRQRALLASCLLLKKPILLLDEPTSALDPVFKGLVIDTLFNYDDLTILSSSHDPDWISKCDQIIDLKNYMQ